MANSYFQFKQFRVDQSLAAMKVCTESCILGALVAAENPRRILDIGTGTGLLSLMAAQKFPCPIDAVEIEDEAFVQAKFNFQASPWKDRLHLFHASIRDFAITALNKYDLIICNPPFFSKHLLSPNEAKNLALHNHTLPHEMLAESIKRLLDNSGLAYVLQPPAEATKFDLIAEQHNLYVQQRFLILNKPLAAPLRYISVYGFSKIEYGCSTLTIKDEERAYSKEFQQLLGPYYLHL